MLQQSLDSLGPIPTPNAIKRRINCALTTFWKVIEGYLRLAARARAVYLIVRRYARVYIEERKVP